MVFTVTDMSFKAGQELTISVKPKSGCSMFSINIGHDPENIVLHFNPRFKYKTDRNVIVCNSKRDGWGSEQRENSFPFNDSEAFKLVFSFNNDQFYVKLPNGTMMSFPNRFGDDCFKYIDVQGDARIQSIKIK